MPPDVQRALQGLYLRHRLANRVRMRVLGDVLRAFKAVGIHALVLKGAALANLIYPDVGLRPMCDIDVLVTKSDTLRAQRVLAGLGFHAPLPTSVASAAEVALPEKHIAAATLHTEGFLISVEVHHNLSGKDHPPLVALEDLTRPPVPFSIVEGDCTAYALGYEEMVWHVCRHMIASAGVFGANRLIWVADVVSFAEHFVAEIDWALVRARYPLILDTLSLLHFLTPLSKRVLSDAPITLGPAPQGIGDGFRGWPHSSLDAQREKGMRAIMYDTFWPSEWWVRLYYGVGSARSLFWYRWVRHPLHIFRLARHFLAGRLREVLP
jgi:hypothetical protein